AAVQADQRRHLVARHVRVQAAQDFVAAQRDVQAADRDEVGAHGSLSDRFLRFCRIFVTYSSALISLAFAVSSGSISTSTTSVLPFFFSSARIVAAAEVLGYCGSTAMMRTSSLTHLSTSSRISLLPGSCPGPFSITSTISMWNSLAKYS